MPNGHHPPFRLRQGRCPSPDHSSDSDTAVVAKRRWKLLARKVLKKWRALRDRRRAQWLSALRLLPQVPGSVVQVIAARTDFRIP